MAFINSIWVLLALLTAPPDGAAARDVQGARSASKLSPAIGRRTFQTLERRALAAAERIRVDITLSPDDGADVAATAALRQIEALTIEHVGRIGSDAVVVATLPGERLSALAAMPQVEYVEESAEITYRVDRAVGHTGVHAFVRARPAWRRAGARAARYSPERRALFLL
jgi:hypothetical protein